MAGKSLSPVTLLRAYTCVATATVFAFLGKLTLAVIVARPSLRVSLELQFNLAGAILLIAV